MHGHWTHTDHPAARHQAPSRAACRRPATTLVGIVLATLVLAPAAVAAQTMGTIRGRVTSESGEPLYGAAISVVGAPRGGTARADGSYQVVLPAGRYELRARLIGYAAAIDTVTVAAGATVTRDFTLSKAATSLEAVAVIGTRSGERTVIDAPVPIDVLTSADIQQSGRVETAQMIQAVAPSFNFPRATIGDGTDHIRPATLRGLAPDQVLVLINGKRRHTSSLVNVNGTIGRGSAAVDLNAIPPSIIDHIEILRDGAAAQYGSDAIAGVINIVLKTNAPANYTMEVGENYTTYNRDVDGLTSYAIQGGPRTARDGKLLQSSFSRGLTIGDNGYLFAGAEIRDRGATNRSLPDRRQQYFTGDPRNAQPPQINHRQGDAYTHDVSGFGNFGTTLANGIELYAFGGGSKRNGDAAGFWRRPLDDRTVRQIYPDGFLPLIQSDIRDGSGAAGLKGSIAGWTYDLGGVYGRNSFHFTVNNSANVSLGPSSPVRFDAGELRFGQFTSNLDLNREIAGPFASPFRVAIGAEFRNDQYEIVAGESASWTDGRQPIYNPDGSVKMCGNNPCPAPVGAQVFPGFRPTDAGSHSRVNEAAYVEVESDITKQLLVGLAGRFEHYSDFGGTGTGKIAARYEVVRGLAFRGAASTGFRAPSLGQEYFSSTATNFINGVPFDIRTFPVSTTEARILGAEDLRPEKSVNLSGGVALELLRSLAVTADYYHTTIKDRIVFSENFTGAAVQQLFAQRGLPNVTGGRYFTNAIETRSNGLDVVANYGIQFAQASVLRLTGGYNQTVTHVTKVKSTPPELSAFQEVLFGRPERGRIEQGQPRNNLLLSANYTRKALGLTARTQRYGAVTSRGAAPTNATGPLDQTFRAKWISDVSGSYTLLQRYTLTVGADNVFDVYPDRNINLGDVTTSNGGTANFGIFPYSGISPFGFNGRFIYTKLSLNF